MLPLFLMRCLLLLCLVCVKIMFQFAKFERLEEIGHLQTQTRLYWFDFILLDFIIFYNYYFENYYFLFYIVINLIFFFKRRK